MAIETLSALELTNFGPQLLEQPNNRFGIVNLDLSRNFAAPANPTEAAIFALGDILSEQKDDLYDTVMPKLLPTTPEEANREYNTEELQNIHTALGQLVASNQLSIDCVRPIKEQLGLPLEPATSDAAPALF